MPVSKKHTVDAPADTAGAAVTALAPTFAAQVEGIPVRADPTAGDIQTVVDLWHRHKLLLFRNQSPDETDLVEFSRRLGRLEIHVRREFLSPTHTEVLYVSNIVEAGRPVGVLADSEVGWHYDQIYLERPAVGSLLCAVTLPESGGATSFADMGAAYRALPDDIKQRLEGRQATQSYEAFNAMYSVPTDDDQRRRTPNISHPVVRTHPRTGERALYVCPGMTTRIEGLAPDESDALLAELFEWTVRPEFVYRHEWRAGDCLLWDNACTMHRREPFDGSQTRLMKRTTILPPQALATPF